MKDITVTAPDGKQSHLENVYIRGNMLRFIIVPDMLQQAPMFKRIGPNAMKGRGIGSARGRATILRGECYFGRIGSVRENKRAFFIDMLYNAFACLNCSYTAQARRGRGGSSGASAGGAGSRPPVRR